MIEQIAAAEAVLTQDEKELGVALVDIGGGTTDIAIFERGSLWHTGRDRRRRRSLHQRHRRRAAHADPRRGEAETQVRLRAVGDGGRGRDDGRRERGRPAAARDGAADPLGDPAAARRGDLPSRVGRDPARRLREVAQLGHRPHRRRRDSRGHAGDRRADLRPADPARARRPASAGWPITSSSPAFATPVGLVALRTAQSDRGSDAHGWRRRVQPRGGPPQGHCSGSSSERGGHADVDRTST